MAGGHALQVVQVPHRVDGPLRGQVVGVGDAPAGLLAGMDLDQLAAGEDPHQLTGRPAPRPGWPIRLPGTE